MVILKGEVFCKKKTKRSSWMITGLGCHKGSFRMAKLISEEKIARKEKFRERKRGRNVTQIKTRSVEERTSIKVNRLESGRAGGLLHIRLRRRDAHMQRSQRLVLKLHFKANDFN